MKKLLLILSLLIASNALACAQTEKAKDADNVTTREVSSEEDRAAEWKRHTDYLERLDKIR